MPISLSTVVRFLCVLIGLFTLSACINLPRSDLRDARNQTMAWEARKTQLHAMTDWTIAGAIAVKNQDRGGQMRFHWQQQQQNYTIDLTAPLGGLIATVRGKPGQVTLEKVQEPAKHAGDPEKLLAEEFGWYFPVKHMEYWIRGLPAPGTVEQGKMTFDEYQHIQTLEQAGWHIEFTRYTQIRGLDVPAKIVLQRTPLLIRMVVTSWQ